MIAAFMCSKDLHELTGLSVALVIQNQIQEIEQTTHRILYFSDM